MSSETQWTRGINGVYTPQFETTWEEYVGQDWSTFLSESGFVEPESPTEWKPILMGFALDVHRLIPPPADAGLAPGETVDGFLLEGNFGSPVAVGLSDGTIVYGHSNEAIEFGGTGTNPIPEPAHAGLALMLVAAVLWIRKNR